MPPELWAILITLLSGLAAYVVVSIRVAGQRKITDARIADERRTAEAKHEVDRKALEDKLEALRLQFDTQRMESEAHQQALQDEQSKYIFEQWKIQNEAVTHVRIQLAESQTSLKSVEAQLQEARSNSAERDRLLGALEEKDRQKAKEIERLTSDLATKSVSQAELQQQLSETVEKLQRTTQERDEIQKQLVELLPLKDEQARQAQQITELLERQAARHEQLNEWQAEMMDKEAALGRANARIAELEAENTKLTADLAKAMTDLERATQALTEVTQGMDRTAQATNEARSPEPIPPSTPEAKL
jgi:chromosome segregation ATPase